MGYRQRKKVLRQLNQAESRQKPRPSARLSCLAANIGAHHRGGQSIGAIESKVGLSKGIRMAPLNVSRAPFYSIYPTAALVRHAFHIDGGVVLFIAEGPDFLPKFFSCGEP